jgi:hypothetical protein
MILEDTVERERREVRNGVVTSLGVHVLLFLLLGWWLGLDAAMLAVAREMKAAALLQREEPKVTMIFPEQIMAAPPQLRPKLSMKRFVATQGNSAAEQKPARADFQSDRNTVASSKKGPAPDGKEAMPTMDGRDSGNLMLTNSDTRMGAQPAATLAQLQPSLPDAPPSAAPAARPKAAAELIEDLERSAGGDTTKLPFQIKKAVPADTAMDVAPSMRAPEEGFVPITRSTASKGSVAASAEDAVNAEMTATGAYMNRASTSLQQRWEALLQAKNTKSIAGCTVSITFFINREGKVEQPTILSKEGPSAELVNMIDLVLEAVLSTEFSPLPRDSLPALPGERMPAKFDFFPL